MPQPPRFEVVSEQERPGNAINPADQARQQAAFSAIMLALKTLSQRTLIALVALRTLLMVGSVFWLWHAVPDPNPYQVASVSIYGVFILVCIFLTRGK